MKQIIIQHDSVGETWNAWYKDRPEATFGGNLPELAMSRLVQLDRPSGYEPCKIDFVADASTADRLVYVMAAYDNELPVCPDCGGTGRYVGLNAIEDCRTCGGGESLP